MTLPIPPSLYPDVPRVGTGGEWDECSVDAVLLASTGKSALKASSNPALQSAVYLCRTVWQHNLPTFQPVREGEREGGSRGRLREGRRARGRGRVWERECRVGSVRDRRADAGFQHSEGRFVLLLLPCCVWHRAPPHSAGNFPEARPACCRGIAIRSGSPSGRGPVPCQRSVASSAPRRLPCFPARVAREGGRVPSLAPSSEVPNACMGVLVCCDCFFYRYSASLLLPVLPNVSLSDLSACCHETALWIGSYTACLCAGLLPNVGICRRLLLRIF